MIKEKQCIKCGKILPSQEFYKSDKTKDGLNSYCKQCHKNVAKENKRRVMKLENTDFKIMTERFTLLIDQLNQKKEEIEKELQEIQEKLDKALKCLDLKDVLEKAVGEMLNNGCFDSEEISIITDIYKKMAGM